MTCPHLILKETLIMKFSIRNYHQFSCTVLELKLTVRHGIVGGEMKILRDAVLCDYMLLF